MLQIQILYPFLCPDIAAMEKAVRSIECDGLEWQASKFNINSGKREGLICYTFTPWDIMYFCHFDMKYIS